MASCSRHSAAEAAFVDADAKLQHHLLEADLESLVGTKRQFARCKAMSGVGGKADLPVERPDFSLW